MNYIIEGYTMNENELNEISKLNKKINELNTRLENHDKILNSYNFYFNEIFINHKLEPAKFLKNIQDLCIELLNFVDNICNKYNLEYWLDHGSILGAIRHGGFIPWDDDIDIGMMRNDYNKFIEIIFKEIKNNGLTDYLTVIRDKESKKNWINTFTQIMFLYDNRIFAGIDIFPYDYISNPKENFREVFTKQRDMHYELIVQGVNRHEVYDLLYENLNLKHEKTNLITPGVEHGTAYGRELILDYNIIFPLKYISFNNNVYHCPNNPKKYLSSIYGDDYMNIPKNVKFHGRQEYLRKKENLYNLFNEFIELLKNVNKNFEL